MIVIRHRSIVALVALLLFFGACDSGRPAGEYGVTAGAESSSFAWSWLSELILDSAVFLPGLVSLPDRVEQSITFSPSGDTLIFSAITGRVEGRNRWAMFYSRRTGDGWTVPDTLPFSGRYSDYGAAFAPDGHALYFSSRRPITDTSQAVPSEYDLWKVRMNASGWGQPRRLANGINTRGNEYSVAVQGTQLIICADRHDALGTSDLFVVERASEFDDFAAVRNIGAPVSTAMWEGQAMALGNKLWWNYVDESEGASEDVLFSTHGDSGWSAPVPLGPRINSTANEFMHWVSPDGRFIFFGRHGDILCAPL